MKKIGGSGYRWKGKKIRVIDDCVTMPRKESVILSGIKVKKGKYYKISICALNKGGNGKIDIKIGNFIQTIYIVSRDFCDFSFEVDSSYTDEIIVSRPRDASGTVLVKEIGCQETEGPKTPEQIKEEAYKAESEKRAKRREDVGKAQSEKERKYREEETKKILEARRDIVGGPVIIGGKGYQWKGRQIRSVYKYNTTCVALRGAGAMILAPANVPSNTKFKVEIEASGNGHLVVNFFGGQNFDGAPARINIKDTSIRKYIVEVKTPDFKPNIKMYLRALIAASGGNICVKTIKYFKAGKDNAIVKNGRPKTHRAPVKRKTTAIPRRKKIYGKDIKENFDMKFKPFDLKKASDGAREVLISRPDQVPLVSIITPTREGRELIEKCYLAINKNTAYPNWEWIIGDSNSQDGAPEYIESLKDDRIKLIRRGTTEGSFSSINNELVEQASGEYYLFLNDDTEPQPFWLYTMMSKIFNREDVGGVGAKLLHGEKRIQHAGIMFMPAGPGNIGKPMLKLFPSGFAEKDRIYQAVTGACFLMRAEDFKKVGGFDPIYYFCYEDVDLCLKITHNLKKKIVYSANSIIRHAESSTQRKFVTSGNRQKAGIQAFKEKWMKRIQVDMPMYSSDPNRGVINTDISFVTCINDANMYGKYVAGSLFLNNTKKNYEIIPILNIGNKYSAASALNEGIKRARANIVVLCHQDVLFYKDWVELLFKRIKEIKSLNWGVLGTAGITEKDKTVGVVYNVKGKMQWRQNAKGTFHEVQTVDEHCMIIRKSSGLMFDEKRFNGFHCYGPDICLAALNKKMKNYGILCPIVHESGSGSLRSGKDEFMRLLNELNKKWGKTFRRIRTTTSYIHKGRVQTYINF